MPANAVTTYDSPQATGVSREDLDDIAYDISPEDTPFMTMAGKGKAEGISHDWSEDALSAISPAGVAEAKAVTDTSPDPPTRLRNVTQINERIVTLSGSAMAVKTADNWGHVDRETARRMKEIKRDIEAACVRNQPLVAGNEGGPIARQARSFLHFIPQTNVVGFTVAASETAAVGAFDVGAGFTYDDFELALQQAYDEGGAPTTALVSSANKALIADFTGRVNSVLDVSQKTVVRDVTVVETPHGKLKVVIERFFPTGATKSDFTLLIDPEYVSIDWLRKIGRQEMGLVGDKRTWLVNGEWTLKVKARKAHAVIGYDHTP